MNLNSLWNPAGVNGVDWSLFLPTQNQVGGNYDAFAYLGLGVLAGLAAGGVGLALLRQLHPFALLRRHGALPPSACCSLCSPSAIPLRPTAPRWRCFPCRGS